MSDYKLEKNNVNSEPFEEREKYYKNLIKWKGEGGHDASNEVRGELGKYMEKLYNCSPDSEDVEKYLKVIRRERKSEKTIEDWMEEYKLYLVLISKRQEYINNYNANKWWFQKSLDDVSDLNKNNFNLWGSRRQLKFGKVVVDTLYIEKKIKLDPVFGALLSPTGGIIGPSNNALIDGDIDEDPIVMHGIVHDACGYLKSYHVDVKSPGYNYLNTWFTFFPTTSPLSCQIRGVSYWRQLFKKIENETEKEE